MVKLAKPQYAGSSWVRNCPTREKKDLQKPASIAMAKIS
jgi:hypothetical protein